MLCPLPPPAKFIWSTCDWWPYPYVDTVLKINKPGLWLCLCRPLVLCSVVITNVFFYFHLLTPDILFPWRVVKRNAFVPSLLFHDVSMYCTECLHFFGYNRFAAYRKIRLRGCLLQNSWLACLNNWLSNESDCHITYKWLRCANRIVISVLAESPFFEEVRG